MALNLLFKVIKVTNGRAKKIKLYMKRGGNRIVILLSKGINSSSFIVDR